MFTDVRAAQRSPQKDAIDLDATKNYLRNYALLPANKHLSFWFRTFLKIDETYAFTINYLYGSEILVIIHGWMRLTQHIWQLMPYPMR